MELDKVIRYLRPNAEFVIYGDTLEGLKFINQTIVKPTQAEVDAAWITIQEAENQALIDQEAARQALFDRLGISADEAKLLLG